MALKRSHDIREVFTGESFGYITAVPESVVKTVQENLFAFLWKNRKDKIKRVVMYQTVKKGGIYFVNFCTVIKALRLAWIGRLLMTRKSCRVEMCNAIHEESPQMDFRKYLEIMDFE